MKRFLIVGTVLLTACAESGDTPPDKTAPEVDTALQSVPVAGAIPEVQRRADEAEAAMAERALQAEEQVRRAEASGSQP